MTRVLILGAGGFIGNAVARAFVQGGTEVICASRREHLIPPGCDAVRLDRTDIASIISVVRDRRVDTLIDMVAYTLADTKPLLEVLDSLNLRYVLISSADVYRNYGVLQRRETRPADQGPLTENAPLRSSRYPYRGDTRRAEDDPQRWMDDYDKIPIEQAVRQLESAWTILRLPMVFGPGDPQQRFAWALAPMLRDETIVAPDSWLDWINTYDHVDLVGAAIQRAATHSTGARRTFNIASLPAISHRDWIERLREATGWIGSVRSSTSEELQLVRATAGLDLSVQLQISDGALRHDLNWVPPLSTSDAIRSLVQSFMQDAPQG